jgi:hypothetical protein
MHTNKPNLVAEDGVYYSRSKSSRSIVRGVTPNRDGDDFSSHHRDPGTGENLERTAMMS